MIMQSRLCELRCLHRRGEKRSPGAVPDNDRYDTLLLRWLMQCIQLTPIIPPRCDTNQRGLLLFVSHLLACKAVAASLIHQIHGGCLHVLRSVNAKLIRLDIYDCDTNLDLLRYSLGQTRVCVYYPHLLLIPTIFSGP